MIQKMKFVLMRGNMVFFIALRALSTNAMLDR